MKQRTESNGSKNDDWATPDWLLKQIKDEFGEFFDPCPLHAGFNGLIIPWKAVNYINPPYGIGKKDPFIKKAWEESQKGNTCIMLLPVATETKSFHEYIWDCEKHKTRPGVELRLLKSRVKFKGYNSKGEYTESGTGQSGSMIVIFRCKR